MPSKSTIHKFLAKVPFETGINIQFFSKLNQRVNKMNDIDKHCVLFFDEMSISKGLTYCKATDKLHSLVDLGNRGRKKILANHALVFMVRGMFRSWKQPVCCYYSQRILFQKLI